jgi:hypothetical protein
MQNENDIKKTKKRIIKIKIKEKQNGRIKNLRILSLKTRILSLKTSIISTLLELLTPNHIIEWIWKKLIINEIIITVNTQIRKNFL